MILLIVDTEGGVAPCEIACILFDTTINEIKQRETTLIPHEMTPKMIEMDLKDPNKKYLRRHEAAKNLAPGDLKCAYNRMNFMFLQCDVILAHNASHDKRIMSMIKEINTCDRPWICTLRNISWPHCNQLSLEAICISQGVKYENAHIALNDCEMLLACLRSLPNLEQRIENQLRPKTRRTLKEFQESKKRNTEEDRVVKWANQMMDQMVLDDEEDDRRRRWQPYYFAWLEEERVRRLEEQCRIEGTKEEATDPFYRLKRISTPPRKNRPIAGSIPE